MDLDYDLFERFPDHTVDGALAFVEPNAHWKRFKTWASKRSTSVSQPT